MLRITRTELPDQTRTLLRLEGNIRGRWVDELRRACEDARRMSAHATGHQVVLDLAGVLFIDADGVAFFRGLRLPATRLTNCSPFIAEQLRGVANGCR